MKQLITKNSHRASEFARDRARGNRKVVDSRKWWLAHVPRGAEQEQKWTRLARFELLIDEIGFANR